MNFKNQLFLAITLFSLGSFAYWNEYKRKPDAEKKALAERKVIPLRSVAVKRIEFERNGETFRFACAADDLAAGRCKVGDPSRWLIEVPIRTKGDDANINTLLTSISNWDPSETIDLSLDTQEKREAYLKDYGFTEAFGIEPREAPKAGTASGSSSGTGTGEIIVDGKSRSDHKNLTIVDKDGNSTKVIFGGKHPVNDASFAVVARGSELDRSKVYLLASYHWSATDHDLTFWRDKKILSIDQGAITEAELTATSNKNEIIRLVKAANGWEVISGDKKLPGDTDAIGSLVSAALFLNAKGYASESKTQGRAKEILAQSKKTVTFKLKTAAKEEVLEIYERTFRDGKKTASTAYAVSPALDPLYELESTVLDRLVKSFDELRIAKLIPGMERFTLHYVSAEVVGNEKEKTTLEQIDGKWKSKETGKEINPAKLNALLDTLTTKMLGPKISPRPDQKSSPAPAGSLRLRLGTKSSNIAYDFTFIKEKDGSISVLDERNASMPQFFLLGSVMHQIPFSPASALALPAVVSTGPGTAGAPPEEKSSNPTEILMDATKDAGQ